MPTVILLDVSLSMAQTVELADTGETVTKRWLAVYGINCLLDYFSANCKLEFVAVIAFSSVCETISTFTRDYDLIRQKLKVIEEQDKTCLEAGLNGVRELMLSEWGNSTPCQVILITDGSPGFGPSSLKHCMNTLSERDPSLPFPLPFEFPSKLFVMCIGYKNDPALIAGIPFYNKLVKLAGLGSTIYIPAPLSLKGIQSNFLKISELQYLPFQATLKCGNLCSPVVLFPTPERYRTFDYFVKPVYDMISDTIEIIGFLDIHDVGSPAAVSRHLVLPRPNKHEGLSAGIKIESDSEVSIKKEPGLEVFMKKEPGLEVTIKKEPDSEVTIKKEKDSEVTIKREPDLDFFIKKEPDLEISIKREPDSEDYVAVDEGKIPSFCVLLHGSLKVENTAALCLVQKNWFGLVYSWADSKKKSNLMLSILEPGPNPIPWLGNLNNLGLVEDFLANNPDNSPAPAFPVKPTGKKSYAQSSVWIKDTGIQSDVQKLLRHARKIPEKLNLFYKELNRIRRSALCIGFIELMNGMAGIFERECSFLPVTAHPDCALHLTYVAGILRSSQGKDFRININPLNTRFESK